MSGSWTGSRRSAAWPVAPSPSCIGAALRTSTSSSGIRWLAWSWNPWVPWSYSYITPPAAPESCTARLTIVSRTVGRSRVELTVRLTALSACSSSTDRVSSCVRAWSSVRSRTFSMAMTAWSAKVVTSSICLSVKGRDLVGG